MVKSELINKIANNLLSMSEHDIELSVNELLNRMTQSLASGSRIEIRGFGSFELRFRAPRNAHNPKTGERVVTISKYVPHFKAGKDMRDRVDMARQNNVAIKQQDHCE
ncbi:MAG: integration host factor subunit beta [Gammaproteobacteria bacterium]|nr:integration host factor subunit beta [Gammaproteobacteria bacterium]